MAIIFSSMILECNLTFYPDLAFATMPVKEKITTLSTKNPYNLRYDNINIINPYHGVEKIHKNNQILYRAKIHVNGYIIIGYFHSIHKAAIAYNKAVDFMQRYVSET